MTNDQHLNEALSGLRDALAGLRGATRSERPAERANVIRVFEMVAAMPFDETNPSIVERRCRLLEQAQRELGL
jgi:hypothetical protein